MIDIDKALLDPSDVFAVPADVCDAQELSHEQKVKVLRRWEHDARELQVAEEENMSGAAQPWSLQDVLAALRSLEAGPGEGGASPTKSGGD